MSEERRIDRKAFFTEGPMSFLRAFVEGARETSAPRRRAPEGPLLRPPGAAPEPEFLNLCAGSGDCARVCPAKAILLLPEAGDPARLTPRIIPSDGACVVCDDLLCMKACPSGALTLVPGKEAIRIGLARVERAECLAWQGEDPACDYCAARCPFGEAAIRIAEEGGRRGPVVVEAGCVGCGVCEHHCPVYPGAIRVFPHPAGQ